jgi:hypothetical protein
MKGFIMRDMGYGSIRIVEEGETTISLKQFDNVLFVDKDEIPELIQNLQKLYQSTNVSGDESKR